MFSMIEVNEVEKVLFILLAHVTLPRSDSIDVQLKFLRMLASCLDL